MLRIPRRPCKTFSSLSVTLTDEHLTFIVIVWRRENKELKIHFAITRRPTSATIKLNANQLFWVLTATGDLFILVITIIVIELSVRIVQDGPAFRVLHSISVTLVMHLAAPTSQNMNNGDYWEKKTLLGYVLSRMANPLPIQIIHRCARAPPFHNNSHNQHSQEQASYQALHTGSYFWTGWVPCSLRTGLKHKHRIELWFIP